MGLFKRKHTDSPLQTPSSDLQGDETKSRAVLVSESDAADDVVLLDDVQGNDGVMSDATDTPQESDDKRAEQAQETENGKKSRRQTRSETRSSGLVAAVGKSFRGLMVGDVLVSDLVQRQLLYIVLVFVLSLWYINNRFLYERQLKELNRTKRELLDLKYKSLNLSKELMQAGRRTTILQELEAQGSELQEATSPIIIIKE